MLTHVTRTADEERMACDHPRVETATLGTGNRTFVDSSAAHKEWAFLLRSEGLAVFVHSKSVKLVGRKEYSNRGYQ